MRGDLGDDKWHVESLGRINWCRWEELDASNLKFE